MADFDWEGERRRKAAEYHGPERRMENLELFQRQATLEERVDTHLETSGEQFKIMETMVEGHERRLWDWDRRYKDFEERRKNLIRGVWFALGTVITELIHRVLDR